jgi:hypothetical protein
VGWLEGPEVTLSVVDEAAGKAIAGEVAEWGGLRGALGESMARSASQSVYAHGPVVALRGADGTVVALAQCSLPEGTGDMVVEGIAVAPNATAGTGRRMMRELSAMAAKDGRGVTIYEPTSSARGFYERIGMTQSGSTLGFSPAEAAAFASGLTGPAAGTTLAGQISWDLAVAGASDWLREHKIKGVVDEVTTVTHQALVDTLADGLERGESTQELAGRIRRLDNVFGPARAERIARTEVITANRAGAHAIGADAGCTEHEWRSVRQPRRTRAWHWAAHGQRVPYDQPFVVSNGKGEPEKLMYPGDSSLGAGPDNVIQCLCSERLIKPGVTDDPALGIDQHGLADVKTAPSLVVAGS